MNWHLRTASCDHNASREIRVARRDRLHEKIFDLPLSLHAEACNSGKISEITHAQAAVFYVQKADFVVLERCRSPFVCRWAIARQYQCFLGWAMSATDPANNFPVDSSVGDNTIHSGLPVQPEQTVNFATPLLSKKPVRPEASKPAAAIEKEQAEPPSPKPDSGEVSSNGPVDSDSVYSDRYQRRGELGRGGWGVVERALDRQLEREVAVKRITIPADVSDEARQRFLHEAKITSQLQHPGVVPVHELVVGANQESTYYVMKLLEGDTLRDHIRRTHRGGLSESEDASTSSIKSSYELGDLITPLLERFIDVCNAVAYAHERGVIHRDLKPANIMVGGFGETIVVDWGLAVKDLESELTERTVVGGGAKRAPKSPGFSDTDGTVIGTPAYMSPEQARGELIGLNAGSDIYSLGIILWEIGAGQHPYRGQGVDEILKDVCEGVRPDLKLKQPLVPPALLAIIEKTLGATPDDRYLTATELAADVRQFMLGEPVSVHPESQLDKAARWCRRNRSQVVTLLTSTLVLLVASLCFGYLINLSRNAERAAKIEARAAHEIAFSRMVEARDSADKWLIDLSGSLEFYPGLDSIRNQLLQDAIEQYERIVAASDSTAGKSRAGENDLIPSEFKLRSMAELENARCHLRLGDLYFLDQKIEKSKASFLKAESILNNLAQHYPSEFAGDLSRLDEIALADWIRFERTNCSMGLAFHDHSKLANSELRSDRRWLQVFTPDDDELLVAVQDSEGTESEFRKKVVSAAVRLEVIACRYAPESQPVEPTLARLGRAAGWARWLAIVDGKSGTRRLYQTAQETLAHRLTDAGQPNAASLAWGQLVKDLAGWTNDETPRPDQLQSLAHARLMKLSHKSESSEGEEAEYRSAIGELNRAWSLSDSDSFYRTNLAAAEFQLAQTMIANDSIEQTPEKLDESLVILRRALATYQELLRENVSIERLRYLANNHCLIVQVLTMRHADNLDSLEIEKILAEHMTSGDLAFQMIFDHQLLEIEDAMTWYELLLHRKTTQILQSEKIHKSLNDKLHTLDQWIGSAELDSDQAKVWQLLKSRANDAVQPVGASDSSLRAGTVE